MKIKFIVDIIPGLRIFHRDNRKEDSHLYVSFKRPYYIYITSTTTKDSPP